MSLIELLIAVSIIAILMGVLSILIIRTFYINRFSIEQGLNASILQNTLKNISNNLREAKQADNGAFMFDLVDDFEIIFYANIDDDNETERLHYYRDGGSLMLGIANPTGDPAVYAQENDEVRVIGYGVVNNSSQPIFHYYNKQYPIDIENNPMNYPVELSDIGMIKIEIFANVQTDQVPNSMHMQTFVRPRNIEHN